MVNTVAQSLNTDQNKAEHIKHKYLLRFNYAQLLMLKKYITNKNKYVKPAPLWITTLSSWRGLCVPVIPGAILS